MATSKRLTIATFVLPILATSLVMMAALLWVVRGILFGIGTDQADWVVSRLAEEMKKNPKAWSLQGDNSLSSDREAFLQNLRDHSASVSHISVISSFDRPLIESGIKQNTSWFSTYSKNDRRDILLSESPNTRYQGNERFYPLKNAEGAVIGTIRVGLNREWRNSQIASVARVMTGIAGLGAVAAAFGAIAFFRLRYTRPLSSLVYAIERVLEGEWSRRLEMLSVEADAAELAVSLNRLFTEVEEDKRIISRLKHESEESEKRFRKSREEGIERTHDLSSAYQSFAERFEFISRETSDGVLLFDSGGNVLQSNGPARKLLGLTADQQGLPREMRKAVSLALAAKEPETIRSEFDLEGQDNAVLRLRAMVLVTQAESPGQRMVMAVVRRRDQEAATVIPVGDLLNNLLKSKLEPSVYYILRRLEKVWPDITANPNLSPEDVAGLESAFRGMRLSCEDLKVLAEVLTLSADKSTAHPTLHAMVKSLADAQEQACARPGSLFHLRIASTVADRQFAFVGLPLAVKLLFANARELAADERLSVEGFALGATVVLRLAPVPAEGSLLRSGDLWKADNPDIRRLLAERVIADFGGKLLLDKGVIEIVIPCNQPSRKPAPSGEPKVDTRVLRFLRGA